MVMWPCCNLDIHPQGLQAATLSLKLLPGHTLPGGLFTLHGMQDMARSAKGITINHAEVCSACASI